MILALALLKKFSTYTITKHKLMVKPFFFLSPEDLPLERERPDHTDFRYSWKMTIIFIM